MTTYAHIADGAVDRVGLPATGTLSDGSAVSGYDKLPASTLDAEGWLPLDDPGTPEHDPVTQAVERSYDVLKTKVNVVYTVTDLPPQPQPEPDRLDVVEAKLAAVEALASDANVTAKQVAEAARDARPSRD